MHVFSLTVPRVTAAEENQEKNTNNSIDNQKFIPCPQQLNYLKASYPI